jgi:hypothetical protein
LKQLRLVAVTIVWMWLSQGATGATVRTIHSFERAMKVMSRASWKHVPDSSEPGVLYAGRVGSLATIVRLVGSDDQLERIRVEVALPSELPDEHALAILARFACAHEGRPRELGQVLGVLKTLRKSVMATGSRSSRLPYRDLDLTLTLDSSSDDFSPRTIEVPWGVLYWSLESRLTDRR